MDLSSITNKLGNAYKNAYSAIVAPPTQSRFLEEGTLTPLEFLTAGDQLTSACPVWSWKPAASDKLKSASLPADKQYLLTQGHSKKRVKEFCDNEKSTVREENLEDDWVMQIGNDEEKQEKKNNDTEVKVDKLLKIEHFQNNAEAPQKGQEEEEKNDGYVKLEEPEEDTTRTYDIIITYDHYYLTPRMWLSGYYKETPLTPEQIWEDIMPEYVKKTVTFEQNPHTGTPQASIHPCKHSSVMKNLIDIINENKGSFKVHQSLFLFLKFMTSVIPGISYDFTVDVDLD